MMKTTASESSLEEIKAAQRQHQHALQYAIQGDSFRNEQSDQQSEIKNIDQQSTHSSHSHALAVNQGANINAASDTDFDTAAEIPTVQTRRPSNGIENRKKVTSYIFGFDDELNIEQSSRVLRSEDEPITNNQRGEAAAAVKSISRPVAYGARGRDARAQRKGALTLLAANARTPSFSSADELLILDDDDKENQDTFHREESERSRPQYLYYWLGFVALFLLIVGITCGVLFGIKKAPRDDGAGARKTVSSWRDVADACKKGNINLDIVSLLPTKAREKYEILRNELSDILVASNVSKLSGEEVVVVVEDTSSCSPQTQSLVALSMTSEKDTDVMGGNVIQYALLSFFFGSNGNEWKNNQGWIEDSDFCNWYGLTCSEVEEVVGIHFEQNSLRGSLVDELYLLQSLKNLTLIEKQFDGTLSSMIGKLTKLESVVLFGTGSTRGSLPTEIGRLTGLRTLQLTDYVGGLLPSEIGMMTSLETLILDRVTNSNIATEISLLTNLRTLILKGNLGGSFPSEMWMLPLLETIAIWPFSSLDGKSRIPAVAFENNTSWKLIQFDQVSFAGPIPTTIGYLQELELLELRVNRLEGTIPSEIGQCTKLSRLGLHSNPLTGTIPSEISNLVLIESLKLPGNRLNGQLPSELGSLVSLRDFSLHSNRLQLNGIPESYNALTNLQMFDLFKQSTNFRGTFPLGLCEIESLTTVTVACVGSGGPKFDLCESISCCTCGSGGYS